MPVLKPFQLLEINVISAQDLEPVSKKMKTYATAWVHTTRKLSTRIDTEGNNSPTWNDKFVFRVDEEFLRLDTSAVMIEIYNTHWFRDTLVGTVRVLVTSLVPPPRPFHNTYYNGGMRCVALQVRRPSGRPQGILNIGVTVLDSSMRSMPLYTQLSASAVGYRDLMGRGPDDNHHDPNYHHQTHKISQNQNQDQKQNQATAAAAVKPILRRSRSEKSTMFDSASMATGSIVAVPQRGGSIKKGKASSVISGAELQEKPKPKGKKKKASSLISASIFSKDSRKEDATFLKDNKANNEKATPEASKPKASDEKPAPAPVVGKPVSKPNGYEYGGQKVAALGNGKYPLRAPAKASSIWSDSEVGPSPSEVAMAMMERRYPLEDDRSSVLDGWSLDESVEGLRSKLERWRTELPPLYDRGLSSTTFRSNSRRKRRRYTDAGNSGLFSCFGNICGIECQCVCGKPPGGMARGGRFYSPSIGSTGRSF